MKKNLLSLCAVLCVIMMQSCAGTYNTAAVMGVQNPVINSHVAAKVDYANATKVQGYGEESSFLGIFRWGKNRNNSFKATNRYKGLSGTEKRAMYDAVEKSGADIILEPQFKNVTKSYVFGLYRNTKTYLNGWAATIVGFEEDNAVKTNENVHLEVTESSSSIF